MIKRIIAASFILLFIGVIALVGSPSRQQLGLDIKLKILPPDPQPGGVLKLQVSLSQLGDQEMSIQLTTITDLNGDYKITEPGETVKYPAIKVMDNQGLDEDQTRGELLLLLYNIPTKQPPEKYTVIVAVGKVSRSTSMKVLSEREKESKPKGWSDPRISNMSKVTDKQARKLRNLGDVLKRGGQDDQVKEKNGSIYVYSLGKKKLEQILNSEDASYTSPIWSPDGSRLAVILNKEQKEMLGLIGLQDKQLKIITEGPSDKSPLWSPYGQHLFFLRNSRLCAFDIEKGQTMIIDRQLQIDHIWGVAKSKGNVIQIIFEAPDQIDLAVKDLYLLELDHQLRNNGVTPLINSPRWLIINSISPRGDSIVYSEDGILYLWPKNGLETRIFNDNYKYFDPSWSPKGDKIVFTSNRR